MPDDNWLTRFYRRPRLFSETAVEEVEEEMTFRESWVFSAPSRMLTISDDEENDLTLFEFSGPSAGELLPSSAVPNDTVVWTGTEWEPIQLGQVPVDEASFGTDEGPLSFLFQFTTEDGGEGQNVVRTIYAVAEDEVVDVVGTAIGVNTAGDVFLCDFRHQFQRSGTTVEIGTPDNTEKISHDDCAVVFGVSGGDDISIVVDATGTATEEMAWKVTVQIQRVLPP